jgi:tRNA (uracil-5-)-methyltransferase
MKCEYVGICGSCTLGNMSYDEQLNFKLQRERERFNDIWKGDIDIIKSIDGGFRNRAEFRVFHKDGKLYYAMNDINKKLLMINNCSIVSVPISNIMGKLLDEIKKFDILYKRFFSIKFLSSTTKDILVTMIYHKKLDDLWKKEAKKLQEKLGIKIIGRSHGQKVVLGDEMINETLITKNDTFYIQYKEDGFAQPNQKVNTQMIQWVLDNISAKDDLCELYCGGGNFTLPLSKKFIKVLATEISKTSIKSAKDNCMLNNIKNIKFIRMSSKEFIEARDGIREFKRMKQEDVILDNYNFSTIFVDPPRAGLDNTTIKLLKEFEQIIYISCNSTTLYRDLKELIKTHKVKCFALFDQFAFTRHIECGVVLNIK